MVSQCPYLGNSPQPPITWGFIKTILAGVQDVLRQAFGLKPKYMPATARPGEVGLMTAPGSVEGMSNIVREEG